MRYTYLMAPLVGLALAAAPVRAHWQGNSGIGRHSGNGTTYGDVVGAAILDQVSRDRQADRDARRTPYASPGYGPIANATQARDACAEDAVIQAGRGARLSGTPSARAMATGWEVEGAVAHDGGNDIPFICSVRNGSVSALALDDPAK